MKKPLFLLASVLLFAALTCCSLAEASDKRILRVSHGQQVTHPDHIGMLAFKEYVESKLGDKYDVQIYPNSLLGDSKNALELCQTGALEYVVCSASNLETFNNMYQIFSFPYLFANLEAYYATMEDKAIIDQIYASTKPSGFEAVTWFDAGSRNFYCDKPIRGPEDLRGMKIRVQPSPTNIAMMSAFGASATPMGFSEVYTALQSRVIDGAENNELALTDQKHGEVAKFFSYDMHQMVPDFLVANVAFLRKLPDEERAVFDEATRVANETERRAWTDKISEAKKIAVEEMKVEFVETDVPAFQEKVVPLYEKLLSGNPKLVPIHEAIMQINREHRK